MKQSDPDTALPGLAALRRFKARHDPRRSCPKLSKHRADVRLAPWAPKGATCKCPAFIGRPLGYEKSSWTHHAYTARARMFERGAAESYPPNIKRPPPPNRYWESVFIIRGYFFSTVRFGHNYGRSAQAGSARACETGSLAWPADLGKCEAGFGQPRSQAELQTGRRS